MKRVLVIGCPGSGKSTFSRRLNEKTGLPVVHLDNLFWNADKSYVSREVFLRRLRKCMDGDAWILDGNYDSSLELRLKCCDTIFLLDYPLELCLDGIEKRRGTVRPDMPWVETEPDEEFLQFIRDFPFQILPKMRSMLAAYPDKKLIIFNERQQSEQFLSAL